MLYFILRYCPETAFTAPHTWSARGNDPESMAKWVPRVLRVCFCALSPSTKSFLCRRAETVYFYLGRGKCVVRFWCKQRWFYGVPFVHIRRCFSASRFKEKGRFSTWPRSQMRRAHNMQCKRHFSFEPSGVVNVFVNLFRSTHWKK